MPMDPNRAYEIGQVAAIGKGRGGDSTRDVEEALATLWHLNNQARRVIIDLRDELEERQWTFREAGWKGGDGIECLGCGAEGPASPMSTGNPWPPTHQLTCPWKQAMDDATTFLGVETDHDDTPKESIQADRGPREDLPLDGKKVRT